MIVGDKRDEVIANIRRAAENKDFNINVEVDDPVVTAMQRKKLLADYLIRRQSFRYKVNNLIAGKIINIASKNLIQKTDIIGLDHIAGISGGAILTSNHFNPIDNIIVRILAKEMGRKTLFVVSQETNLMMQGLFGFLMNYADILPISMDHNYMVKHFEPMLRSILQGGELVLIYPEQEMWFNYRKPRPLKPGAYHYAAKLKVPIISCFIEMSDLADPGPEGFRQVAYTLHVLKPIYPDPKKTVKENRIEMCEQDYRQKKAAYEAAYHKPLDYPFEQEDIAGWIPSGSRPPNDEIIPAAELL